MIKAEEKDQVTLLFEILNSLNNIEKLLSKKKRTSKRRKK